MLLMDIERLLFPPSLQCSFLKVFFAVFCHSTHTHYLLLSGCGPRLNCSHWSPWSFPKHCSLPSMLCVCLSQAFLVTVPFLELSLLHNRSCFSQDYHRSFLCSFPVFSVAFEAVKILSSSRPVKHSLDPHPLSGWNVFLHRPLYFL